MLHWLWNNKQWLFEGAGITALTLIFGAITWVIKNIFHRGKRSERNSVEPTITQSPTVNQSPIINVSLNANTLQETGQNAIPSESITSSISFVQARTVRLDYARIGVWSLAASGKKGLIVSVVNNPAPAGVRTIPANSVAATIDFADDNGRPLAHISKSYWLGKETNLVDLGIGEQADILIGTYDGFNWTTYENGRSTPFRPSLTRTPTLPLLNAPPHLMLGRILVHLQIVAHGTGDTLLSRRFHLVINGGADFLVQEVGGQVAQS